MATEIHAASKLVPGSVLGHFKLVNRIGAGGMGVVFEAWDMRLNRRVALKVPETDHFRNESARRRFLREAQLAAQIAHPNVATIHEVDDDRGMPFIAMELVQGANLRELLTKADGPLPMDRLIDIGSQVCDALEAAHGMGVIHRDIKSSNIMVTPDGTTKVLDFGLAKALNELAQYEGEGTGLAAGTEDRSDDLTPQMEKRYGRGGSTAGVAMGTPCYMSPEQASGRAVDARTDIFSLGIVLYEAASGSLPFQGSTDREVLDAIRCEDPTPLYVTRREVRADFSEVISKSLAKEPEDRFQSAADMRAELQRLDGATAKRRSRTWFRKLAPALAVTFLVSGYAVWTGVLPSRFDVAPAEGRIRSVAILPFRNLGPDGSFDYFGAGLAEILSAKLTNTSLLEVRSIRGSRGELNDDDDLVTLTRELGVDALLSGSYQIDNGVVSLTYALTDSRRNVQVMGDAINEEFTNAIEIEHRLVAAMIGSLKGTLNESERARLSVSPTSRQDAFQELLRAAYARQQFWRNPSAAQIKRAEQHFLNALDYDPELALAYVGLAQLHWRMVFSGYAPAEGVLDQAQEEAATAIALDPTLGDAYAARSLIEFQRGDLDAMKNDLDEAARRSPRSALMYYGAGYYFIGRGIMEESVKAFRRARELDPQLVRREIGLAHRFQGQFGAAEEQMRQDLEEYPRDLVTASSLTGVLITLGDLDGAREIETEFLSRAPDDPLAQCYVTLLRVSEDPHFPTEPWLDRFGETYWSDAGQCLNVATVMSVSGDIEGAVRWLRRATELGFANYTYLAENPLYDGLRHDARFREYLAEIEAVWREELGRQEAQPLLPNLLAE